MSEAPELEPRLATLTRQNNILKGTALLLGGVVVGMLVSPRPVPQAPPPPPVSVRVSPIVTVAPPPVAVATATATPPAAVATATPPAPASSARPVAELSPTPARPPAHRLQIVLSPPATGVLLYLDGHAAGTSTRDGVTVPASPGRHHVAVRAPGYVRTGRDVQVGEQPLTVTQLPALRVARLSLDSNPPGSRVHLDGPPHTRPLETFTPAHFKALHPGRWRIEVSHAGYESEVMIVRLTPGGQLYKHAQLSTVQPVAFYAPPVRDPVYVYRPRITGVRRYRPGAPHYYRARPHAYRPASHYYRPAPHVYTNRVPPTEPGPRATPMDDPGTPSVSPPAGGDGIFIPGPAATPQ